MPNQLDQGAVNLAKAIRDAESGGDFNARGASGEFGAYQFMPDTWNAYAREAGVNAAYGSATPDQQNEVAYKKIKQWKDQGYNVGQIASMWNAGVGRPNAYKENWKGVNSKGVAYDTPAYAEKVAKAYQKLKGQTATATVPEKPEEGKSFVGDAANAVGEGFMGIGNAWGDFARDNDDPQNINLGSAALRTVAGGARAFTGLVDAALTHTPVVGSVYKGLNDIVGAGVEGLMNTSGGQAIAKEYGEFAQEHPEFAGNISAAGDILAAVPAFKGVGLAKNKVGGALGNVMHGKVDPTLEAVSPHMTPKKAAEAIARRGTEQRGLLGTTYIKDDPFDVRMADTVKALVPKFNPNKPALNNINAIQTVVNQTNKQLKQRVAELGQDRIYSYKELGAALKKLDVPDIIAAEPYLQNLHDRLVGHAIRIAKSKGGKVPKLLEVRQEFDQLVRKQYPNLYNDMDRTSPLRESVKNIRDALTEFTAKSLPEDVLLKETLMQEHLLLNAIENMAEKASKGATKEIGLNAIDRYGKRHPMQKGLVKLGVDSAVRGAGIGGFMKILD